MLIVRGWVARQGWEVSPKHYHVKRSNDFLEKKKNVVYKLRLLTVWALAKSFRSTGSLPLKLVWMNEWTGRVSSLTGYKNGYKTLNQCALKKKKSSLLKLDFMADTNKVLAKCVGEHTNIFKVLECFPVFLFVCLLIPFPFFFFFFWFCFFSLVCLFVCLF